MSNQLPSWPFPLNQSYTTAKKKNIQQKLLQVYHATRSHLLIQIKNKILVNIHQLNLGIGSKLMVNKEFK